MSLNGYSESRKIVQEFKLQLEAELKGGNPYSLRCYDEKIAVLDHILFKIEQAEILDMKKIADFNKRQAEIEAEETEETEN